MEYSVTEKIFYRHYNCLVLSSGGIKGIIQLGILHELIQQNPNILSTVNIYSGCSVGSIISCLLSMGFSPLEIFSTSLLVNIGSDVNISQLSKNYGLYDIDAIFSKIEKIIIQKYGYIPTLKRLYELTNNIFICNSYNLSKHDIVYFSYQSHPELSCVDCLKMSCNIPLIFGKIEYQGNLYIDGGFADQLPVKYVDETYPENNILCIDIKNKISEIRSIFGYITELAYIPIKIQKKYEKTNVSYVNVSIGDNILSLSLDKKYKYFLIGKEIFSQGDSVKNKQSRVQKEKIE